MRRSYCVVLGVVVLFWSGTMAYDWWTHRGLITLDAVNQEIRPVLKSVSRQSGVPVVSSTNTTGKVTVHFRRVPLQEALEVLCDQTEGRTQTCLLIARNSTRLEALGAKLAESGPPFLITQVAGRFMGPPAGAEAKPTPVRFSISKRDLHSAGMTLALLSRTPVLVEDGLNPTVSLEVPWADVDSLANKLARAGHARAQRVYLFQTTRGWRGGGRGFSNRDGVASAEDRMQKIYDEQLPLLPPEEQEAIRKVRDEWQQRREELASLTPEERRARIAEMMNDPNREARMDQRSMRQIKNLTPEQRAQRNRRIATRAKQHGVTP